MPAPPPGYGNPSGPYQTPNPTNPTGIGGLIGGETAPSGAGGTKGCGYDVNIPLPWGGTYTEFVKLFDVASNAPCPGNTHEDDTQGQGSAASGGATGITGILNFVSNSSNWKHLGLLLAGAVLVFVGVQVLIRSEEGAVVSTVTGT